MEMQQEQHGFDLNAIYPGNGETEDKRTAKVTLRWWRQTKTKVQTERFRFDMNENLKNFLFTANYETPTFFSLSRHE